MQAAANQDDALTQAIAAAENLMNAVKLTVDPNEKKLLTKRFNVAADVARSIKDNTWSPPKPSARISVGKRTEASNDQVNNADAAGNLQSHSEQGADGLSKQAANVVNPVHQAFDTTSSTQHKTSGTKVGPRATFKLFESSDSTTSRVYLAPYFPADNNEDAMRPDQSPNTSWSQMDRAVQDDLNARFAHVALKEAPAQPKTSVSHVRTLREPLSSRKRAVKEEIILLKASLVNGIKCPPWDKIPSSDEFALHLTGVFTYVYLFFPVPKHNPGGGKIERCILTGQPT